MSYFSGCQGILEMIMKFMISMIFISIIIFPRLSSSSWVVVDEGYNNPVQELSSREELVQLAGYGEEKLSTVLVTGTVLCEVCLHGESQLRSWPISGALVAIKCRRSDMWSETSTVKAVTDEYGDFLIDIPSHLHAIANLDKACSVKVLKMPKNAMCRPANVRNQRALTLSSVGNGIRTYTTGDIKFLHLTSRPFRACTKMGSSGKQIAL